MPGTVITAIIFPGWTQKVTPSCIVMTTSLKAVSDTSSPKNASKLIIRRFYPGNRLRRSGNGVDAIFTQEYAYPQSSSPGHGMRRDCDFYSGSGELEELRFFTFDEASSRRLATITAKILNEFRGWLGMSPAEREARELICFRGMDNRLPEL